MRGSHPYQDKSAIGLLASAKLIVLGRVACSSAYALPVRENPSALFRPSMSRALSLSSFAISSSSGLGIMQKLTNSISKLVRFSGETSRSYCVSLQDVNLMV